MSNQQETTLPVLANPSTEAGLESQKHKKSRAEKITDRRRRKKMPTNLPTLDLWEVNVLLLHLKGETPEQICRVTNLPMGSVESMIDKIAVYRTLTDPDQARGKQAWLVNSLSRTQQKSLKMLFKIGMGETGQDVDPSLILKASEEVREVAKALQPKGVGTQVQVGVALGRNGNGGNSASGANFEKVLRGVIRERQEQEGDVIDAEVEEVESEDNGS